MRGVLADVSAVITSLGESSGIFVMSGASAITVSQETEAVVPGEDWSLEDVGNETWTDVPVGAETWTAVVSGDERWSTL